jgi:hypothetical protein
VVVSAVVLAAAVGERERAEGVVTDAEEIARSLDDPYWQAEHLTGLTKRLASAHDDKSALQIVQSIADPAARAFVLTSLSQVAAASGPPRSPAAPSREPKPSPTRIGAPKPSSISGRRWPRPVSTHGQAR